MILFLGDPHGRFDHVIEAVMACHPEAIVLLGDIQARRPLDIELAPILGMTDVWFIHGNHDTDSDLYYDNLFGSALADKCLHGRVAEVAGVRIAGLGGVFRGQVWIPPEPWNYLMPKDFAAHCGAGNLWRGGVPRKHRSTIFPSDLSVLFSEKAEILVTHEAPSAHPHGFSVIDELANSLEVSKTFHGHHHDRRDYSGHALRLGFDAYGVGLRGITDINGQVVLAGEQDCAPEPGTGAALGGRRSGRR